MGLLAAHDKRIAEAKAENAALNAALTALVHDAKVISDGFSSGSLTPAAAVQACLDVDAWYWQYINPYTQYHNAVQSSCNPDELHDSPKLNANGGRCFQSIPNTGQNTAALFLGCNVVDASLGMLRAAILALQSAKPGTTKQVNFCGWSGDQYGLQPFGGMTLQLTVPSATQPQELTINPQGILSLGSAPSSNDAVIASGAVVGGSTQSAGLLASGGGTLGLSGISPQTWLLIALGAGAIILLRGSK